MRARWEAAVYAALPAVFLLLFFVVPVVTILLQALGLGGHGLAGLVQLVRAPREPLTALGDALLELWDKEYYNNRIVFTFEQAALSTLLTLLVGLPLAYLFSHHEFPGRRFLRAAFTAPFILPAIVVALALHAYVGPRGYAGFDLLTPLGPLGAILLAHVFYNTSLVLRLVGNQWERLPTGYGEAARTLGLGRLRTILHVDLPLLRPSILAASLLVFMFCFTSFGIILFLRGDAALGTIETTIYDARLGYPPRYSLAAALALLQLLTTYLALTAFVLLQRRQRVGLIPQTDLQRPRLPAWGAAVIATASLLLLGPPLALTALSFRYRGEWSTQGWRLLTSSETGYGLDLPLVMENSLLYATTTLVFALALGWLAALAVHRARHAAWAEGLLLLPLGVSSVVIGLGLFLAWDGVGLPDLRATSTGIVLAHILVAFPFASRVLSPTLDTIAPSLRETARTLGASRWAVVRLVDLPLSYPALGVAAVYAFGASLGEFGATLFLRTPETATIPVAIFQGFNKVGAPFHAQANALAVLLLATAILSFLLLEKLRRRTWGEFG